MATITYHDRYIPAGQFAKRHYEVIARTLKEANADIPMVEAFVEVLEQDNPRFKAALFRKAST